MVTAFKNIVRYDRTRETLQQVFTNPKAATASLILGTIVFLTVVAPLIIPYDPTTTNPAIRNSPPGGAYLFGTDHLGRDLFSRVLMGGRTTLVLGLSAVGLALRGGVPLGMLAGYRGGRTDDVIMRVMDLVMSFPTILLALLILTAVSSSMWNAIAAIGLVFIPKVARIVRSSTLSVKNESFVQAAEVRGESDAYIMFVEILPNIMAPIMVEGTIRIGYAIIIGASLSFLGLGVQPPQPDWGYMVSSARAHIWNNPWFMLFPAIFLGATIFAFNLLGDGLRDVLDPEVEGGEL
jgi:peptide/nickel transport system permease protein